MYERGPECRDEPRLLVHRRAIPPLSEHPAGHSLDIEVRDDQALHNLVEARRIIANCIAPRLELVHDLGHDRLDQMSRRRRCVRRHRRRNRGQTCASKHQHPDSPVMDDCKHARLPCRDVPGESPRSLSHVRRPNQRLTAHAATRESRSAPRDGMADFENREPIAGGRTGSGKACRQRTGNNCTETARSRGSPPRQPDYRKTTERDADRAMHPRLRIATRFESPARAVRPLLLRLPSGPASDPPSVLRAGACMCSQRTSTNTFQSRPR